MDNNPQRHNPKIERLICHYYWSALDKLLVASTLCTILGTCLAFTTQQAPVLGTSLSVIFWIGCIASASALITTLLLLALRKVIFSPEALFKRLRHIVEDNIFETARLKDWQHWQDTSQITSMPVFYDQANAMLDSLGDFYTCLLSPEKATPAIVKKAVPISDTGLHLGVLRSEEGKLILDEDSNLLPVKDKDDMPVVASVVADTAAHQAGLLSGDSLLSINKKSLKELSLPAIHETASLQKGEAVALSFSRNGQEHTVTLTVPPKTPLQVQTKVIKDKVIKDLGYTRFESFWDGLKLSQIESALSKIAECRAVIVDLRANSGGDIRLALGALSAFVDEGVLVYSQRRSSDTTRNLRFFLHKNNIVVEQLNPKSDAYENIEPREIAPRLEPKFANKPIVVLIDEYSMSGAELFAGALKDLNRAHLIGTQTFGKGIGQDEINIPPSVRVSVTSMRYTTPAGIWPGDGGISIRNGITPHETVKQPAGTAFGDASDTQLNAAISYLASI